MRLWHESQLPQEGWQRQKTFSASPAWETSTTFTLPPACSASALPASVSGLGVDACPACMQPLEHLLHSVQGEDYEEYVVGLPSAHGEGLQLVPAEALQPAQLAHHQPPLGWQKCACEGWQCTEAGAASGPSNATSQQAPTASVSGEPSLPSASECPAGPDVALERAVQESIAVSPGNLLLVA